MIPFAPAPTATVTEPATATILSISPMKDDHRFLEDISDDSTEVVRAESLTTGLAALKKQPVALVICESELGEHTWKKVLKEIHNLPYPPLLIVTSRLADDYLWAEALNLGAYDVLAKPFDPMEVTRTIESALRRRQN
jgi:DNA-binding response OmpR family regulator